MTSAGAVAALLGLAVALLVGPPPARGLRRLRPVAERGPRRRGLPVLLALSTGSLVWAGFGWRVLGWAVAATAVATTVTWVLGRHARSQAEHHGAAEVARAGGTVALLLASGRIPTEALTAAAEDCPCLAPAAAAVSLGADPVEVLRSRAREPGMGGLATMAAAWRVSERTGAPVAGVMGQVAQTLRQEQEVADVVATELSAARMSGRIMALLPFAAMGLGTAVGADPLGFLLGETLGQWLLLAGTALACAGVVWTERIAAGDAWTPRGVAR